MSIYFYFFILLLFVCCCLLYSFFFLFCWLLMLMLFCCLFVCCCCLFFVKHNYNLSSISEAVSSQPVWWHYLSLTVPDKLKYPNDGFLFIDGGGNHSP